MSRKQFFKKLEDESIKYRYIKNKIDHKKGSLWNSDEGNSIVHIEKESIIKVNESECSSFNYLNFHSHQHSDLENDYAVSDQKNKTDKFKKLAIQLDDEEEFQNSKDRSEKETY